MAAMVSHVSRPARVLDSVGCSTLNARHPLDGAVAQLGERVVRNDEVRGSIPLSSTSRIDGFRPGGDFPYFHPISLLDRESEPTGDEEGMTLMAKIIGSTATICALAMVLAGMNGAAFAQESKPAAEAEKDIQETAIDQIAEAIAMDSACRSLQVDLNIMTVIVQRAGLDMDKVLEEAGSRSAAYLEQYAKSGEQAVCQAGMILYGPKGSNAMNFLIPE